MKQKKYKYSKNKIFKVCEQALANFEAKIEVSDDKSGVIEAKKGSNLFSYGNKIVIEIDQNNKEFEVRIYSKSIGIQIIDWGTNQENENEIFQIIDNLLK